MVVTTVGKKSTASPTLRTVAVARDVVFGLKLQLVRTYTIVEFVTVLLNPRVTEFEEKINFAEVELPPIREQLVILVHTSYINGEMTFAKSEARTRRVTTYRHFVREAAGRKKKVMEYTITVVVDMTNVGPPLL